MRFFLMAGLSLILAGCPLDNDSSSNSNDTTDSTADTTTPDNTGDSGDSSGDTPGDSIGDGGDTTEPTTPVVVDCGWETPADVTPTNSLGATATAATYDIANVTELTSANTDLTGTWVLIHKFNRVNESSTGTTSRTVSEIQQKFIFVIRDTGSGPEAASCLDNEFVALGDTSAAFNLPLFSTSTTTAANEAPEFTLNSNTSMSGSTLADYSYNYDRNDVTLSGQVTEAVKISSAAAALGSHTINMNYDTTAVSSNADDVWCFRQSRELSASQICEGDIGSSALTLTLTSAATAGLASFGVAELSDGIISLLLHNDGDLSAVLQSSLPSTLTVSTGDTSASANIIFNDAVPYNDSSITATADYSLSLP